MPSFPPPAATGGGGPSFSYGCEFWTVVGTTATSPAPLLTGSFSFAGDGVSMASNLITVPSGLWLMGVDMEVSGGAPTTGDLSIGILPSSGSRTTDYLGWLNADEIKNWTGKPPIISGANLFRVPTNTSTVRVRSYQTLNDAVSIWGSVWGTKVGEA